MTRKRTLILDENDLIMVVDKEVVSQIDDNRGEMNRTEFVNFLIQSQLKESDRSGNYVDKEEFHRFTEEVRELLRNFLEFFLSYGLAMGRMPPDDVLKGLSQHLQALDSPGCEADDL